MNRRRRLTWVTALTVASLLLGGGALNALAEGHGGGGGEGDSHGAQRAHPAQAAPNAQNSNKPVHQDNDTNNTNVQKHQDDDNNNNNVQRHDDDNEDLVTPPARVTDDDRPGLGCGDDNHTHTGAPGNPDNTCKPPDAENDDQSMTTDDASAAVSVAGVAAAGDDQNGD